MAANLAYRPTGLQSLALDEYDIYEYEKSVGDVGGIADLGAMRERLEKLGRFGDDTLAHVETGELIVPKPLLDKMPELKESILGHLREMGVEDPERYIVGSAANSINPETGSPEFFLKKIFRGISKAVKSVGKFLKKAAPTIIKIAGTAILASTGVGLPYAAAIASGIGTLAGGGSIGDALKSAAIGGVTGYLAGPLGEVASNAIGGAAQAAVAGGDAGDILKGAALGGAGAAAGKLLTPSLSDTALGRTLGMKPGTSLGEDLSKTGEFFGVSDAAAAGTGSGMGIDTTSTSPAADLSPGYGPGAPAGLDASAIGDMYGTGAPAAYEFTDADFGGTGTPAAAYEFTDADFGGIEKPVAAYEFTDADFGGTGKPAATGPLGQTSDYLEKTFPEYYKSVTGAFDDPVKTFLTGEESLTAASPKVVDAVNAAKAAELQKLGLTPEALRNEPIERQILVRNRLDAVGAEAQHVALANQPGLLARNPYLATVPLVAAPFVMGPLMETPEMEKPDVLNDPRAAGPSEELINQYRLGRESLFPGVTPASERRTLVATSPTSYGYSQYLRQQNPELFAADGGGVFPRRTGGIMPDEGIPGKDSVKALVMPGEFIFTTDAVRGAGNGNLRQGINNMYNVMRNLEARGKRMA
jgi:hypothetical protein